MDDLLVAARIVGNLHFSPVSTNGAWLVEPRLSRDDRGSFSRSWCSDSFAQAGIAFTPVQGNTSLTRQRHSIRGMHFQREPRVDAKIVRCSRGAIHDVIVDLRADSATRGETWTFELSSEGGSMLYVPAGFAHGFQTLCDDSIVEYLMGAAYCAELYDGFRYDDPAIGIAWPFEPSVLSENDLAWPPLAHRMPWLERVG